MPPKSKASSQEADWLREQAEYFGQRAKAVNKAWQRNYEDEPSASSASQSEGQPRSKSVAAAGKEEDAVYLEVPPMSAAAAGKKGDEIFHGRLTPAPKKGRQGVKQQQQGQGEEGGKEMSLAAHLRKS